jgi:AcrR family transcriptional regulator
MVASGRRRGVESSATRAILIDAAAQLIREEGYPAVTARRVASKAGLKPQLVHYYFRTMDELFVAVIRQGSEQMLERVAQAVASQQPLKAVWRLGRDNKLASLSMEFLALASHRKAVRAEVKHSAEQFRIVQTAALTRDLQVRGVKPRIPPIVTMVLMSGVSQLLMLEAALGVSLGHAETHDFIENCLERSERRSKRSAPLDSGAARAGASERSTARKAGKRPRAAAHKGSTN